MKGLLVGALGGAAIVLGGQIVYNHVDIIISDDHSFYVTPDENAWPGNALSEKQFDEAVAHFADADVCSHPWRWAAIGPQEFLLKGTRYRVVDAYNASWPNVHWTKGYWGGNPSLHGSVFFVKRRAEIDAAKDCMYGIKP